MTLFGVPDVENLKAKGNVKGLIKALGYKRDAGVRTAAAEALVEIGATAVLPLIAALRGTVHPPRLERDLREALVGTLVQIAGPAVEPLVGTLNDAAAVVKRMGSVLQDRALTKVDLLQRYQALYRSVAIAMGQIGDLRAVPPLIAALVSEDLELRRASLEALELIGTPAVVEPLADALVDTSLAGRWAVAWALGQIGDAQGVVPLAAALGDEDWDVRRAAAAALGRIGDGRAVRPLYMALKGWQQNRQDVIKALGQIVDQRSVNALISSLNDKDIRVRLDAAKALVRMYRSGKLGEEARQAILAQRSAIKRVQRDVRRSTGT
jgi:HEAT repeat protein